MNNKKQIIIGFIIIIFLLIFIQIKNVYDTNTILPNKITSVGSKLAEDPKWFKRPPNYNPPKPTKYIKSSDKYGAVGEQADWINSFNYLNDICKNEQITMINKKYKEILKEDLNTLIYLRNNDRTPNIEEIPITDKNKNNVEIERINDKKYFDVTSNIVFKGTTNFQYNRNFSGQILSNNLFDKNLEDFIGKKVDFSFQEVNNAYHMKNQLPKKSILREFLSYNGKIYKITYDSNSTDYYWGNYVNLEKENGNNYTSQYYSLWREYRTKKMNEHFIVGKEFIVYDKTNDELVEYRKNFIIGNCNARQGRSENCVEPQSWKNLMSCQTNNRKEF